MDSEKLTKELKKRGIPFTIMEIGLTPEEEEWQQELETEIWEYLTENTLIFGESEAPNYFGAFFNLKEVF